MTPVLKPGWHAWVWPLNKIGLTGWVRRCALARELGLVGLIPQESLNTDDWAARKWRPDPLRTNYIVPAHVAKEHGLQFTAGLGLDSYNAWRNRDQLKVIPDAILGCLEAAPGVMLNWEGQWENDADDRQRANTIVDKVLAANPSADRRCTDAPWWAPLWHWRTIAGKRKKGYTHPSAPTREFGRLCKGQRFVQAYGAHVPGSPDGASSRMLAWSRDPSQYPSLGFAAANILPANQAYSRSVNDIVKSTLAEPTGCLWHLDAMSTECKLALRFVKAIGEHGFTGPAADVEFQKAAGIRGPTLVGPMALRAAGVDVPASKRPPVWYTR
jgi:hypothetical protein